MSSHGLFRLLGMAVMLSVTVGCGERLYSVKGSVTFEGKPLPGGGSISFVPKEGARGRAAGGEINEDGTFVLTTDKPGDGAMVGEYRVVIHQTTEKEGKNEGDNGKSGVRGPSLPKEERIHSKFADHYNSPLTAKVEAISLNELNFPLKRE
jgi:hypothetical protein